jgi:hypothetical protein
MSRFVNAKSVVSTFIAPPLSPTITSLSSVSVQFAKEG